MLPIELIDAPLETSCNMQQLSDNRETSETHFVNVRYFTRLPKLPDLNRGVNAWISAKFGETSIDTVDMARRAPQVAQAGNNTTTSVLKEGMPVTKASQHEPAIDDKACYALNDRRFITHLKLLTIIQRVIVGQRLQLLAEDKEHLYLGHLYMLHLASRGEKKCRAPSLEEWVEVERKIIALEKYLSPPLLTYVEINHLSGKILEKVALCLFGVSITALPLTIDPQQLMS